MAEFSAGTAADLPAALHVRLHRLIDVPESEDEIARGIIWEGVSPQVWNLFPTIAPFPDKKTSLRETDVVAFYTSLARKKELDTPRVLWAKLIEDYHLIAIELRDARETLTDVTLRRQYPLLISDPSVISLEEADALFVTPYRHIWQTYFIPANIRNMLIEDVNEPDAWLNHRIAHKFRVLQNVILQHIVIPANFGWDPDSAWVKQFSRQIQRLISMDFIAHLIHLKPDQLKQEISMVTAWQSLDHVYAWFLLRPSLAMAHRGTLAWAPPLLLFSAKYPFMDQLAFIENKMEGWLALVRQRFNHPSSIILNTFSTWFAYDQYLLRRLSPFVVKTFDEPLYDIAFDPNTNTSAPQLKGKIWWFIVGQLFDANDLTTEAGVQRAKAIISSYVVNPATPETWRQMNAYGIKVSVFMDDALCEPPEAFRIEIYSNITDLAESFFTSYASSSSTPNPVPERTLSNHVAQYWIAVDIFFPTLTRLVEKTLVPPNFYIPRANERRTYERRVPPRILYCGTPLPTTTQQAAEWLVVQLLSIRQKMCGDPNAWQPCLETDIEESAPPPVQIEEEWVV